MDIAQRDKDAIRQVARSSFVRSPQIVKVVGGAPAQVQRRLQAPHVKWQAGPTPPHHLHPDNHCLPQERRAFPRLLHPAAVNPNRSRPLSNQTNPRQN